MRGCILFRLTMAELLHNAIIINEGHRFHGWLTIDNQGIISRIGVGDAPTELLNNSEITVRDMQRHWLLPGVIDSHVHFREPGLEHKATIYSESRAAAAGGVTSFMEMPNTNPATTTIEALEDKYSRAAKDSAINYAFYIGATRDNWQTLSEVDYTRVPGIKLFMGSSTGGMLVDGVDSLEKIFELPALIAVHCEQEEIVKENMRRVQELYPDSNAPLSWHPEIRSALACYTSTHRAVEMARRKGTRLHVMHLTTAEEIALFHPDDKRITAEVCVAHLWFTDEDYANLGTRIKCNPAVKSLRHREALRRGLVSGEISTVSTDHAPHTLEEKSSGTITAPSGMPMVQFSLPAMLTLADKGLWTPELVVEKMCHAQARLFNIEKRGFIREGYYADLVEIDPDGTTPVTADILLSKCGWSPLEGTELRTKIITTRVNGQCVYCHAAPEATGYLKGAMPLRFRN